jgi:hypothetical protein
MKVETIPPFYLSISFHANLHVPTAIWEAAISMWLEKWRRSKHRKYLWGKFREKYYHLEEQDSNGDRNTITVLRGTNIPQ